MKLQVQERRGKRVLTTQQLAEHYGTESKTLLKNFERNRERYTEGLHYFSLTGEDLRDFKRERQNDDSLKYVSVLYLWTERGALLLAKSINTDVAWEVYEYLVETYFRFQQVVQAQQKQLPQTYLEALKSLVEAEETRLQLESKIEEDKPKVEFAEAILSTEQSIEIGEFARLLNKNGIKLGRNNLFILLRENKFLMSTPHSWNIPYQKYLDQGIFEVVENAVEKQSFKAITFKTLVTPKGQIYLTNKLKTILGGK